jgi:glutamate/tyrosine decarboxylase-like PLP-dependent enzyme
MALDIKTLSLLTEAASQLDDSFSSLPLLNAEVSEAELAAMREVLLEVAERLKDNFPYPHPMYAGQMLKPPHAIARLAYALSMWINPNNHALDGGRASSQMEKEAVACIATMFGWHTHLGHLCGGGTMANLEALWVAGRLKPGLKILASEQAHYTHERISHVLGLPFEMVPCDARGRMDTDALLARLRDGDVGTVVATSGTTALGAVDPLPQIVDLQQQFGFRMHVDAAYGGYFILADHLTAETRAAFDTLRAADSIAVDPHKHGLQPYGCGCILFKDPNVAGLYKHDSPYTYFSSADLHLGEISLECSRAGASAVALWATQRLLPTTPGGTFAANISRCHQAALTLFGRLNNDPRFMTALEPELDIVVWAPRGHSATDISQKSRDFFNKAAAHSLHLALVTLPKSLLRHYWGSIDWDLDQVTCLRSCLMKPEHLDWIDRIWDVLDEVSRELA